MFRRSLRPVARRWSTGSQAASRRDWGR